MNMDATQTKNIILKRTTRDVKCNNILSRWIKSTFTQPFQNYMYYLYVHRYENQMELLKQSHQREMERIKRSSDHGEGLQTEVTQLQNEMEQMSQKYMREIESLKVKHAEELDQLKTVSIPVLLKFESVEADSFVFCHRT